MAAKLKACQEIQLPPNRRPIPEYDLDAQQRRQQILAAAATSAKSPMGRHRYSHINNGSINLSHIPPSSLSHTNTTVDKSMLSDSLTTNSAI